MENAKDERSSRFSIEGFSLSDQQPQGTYILAVRLSGGQSPLELEVDRRSLEGLSYILRQQSAGAQGQLDDPIAVELRRIRELLSRIEGAVPLSDEIAVRLFDMIDANYLLPKRDTG